MHPLIITPLYPPATGGAATYFDIVVSGLIKQPRIRHLTVLTERMPGQPIESTHGTLRILRYLPTRISIPRRSRWAHVQSYAQTQLWFRTRLPQLVRRFGVDVIHFHTRYRGRLLYAGLTRSRVPIVANLHDRMTIPSHLRPVADWLLCCAQGVQRFAVDAGYPQERIVLIPLPMAIPEPPSAEQVSALRTRHGLETDPYLLFVGDITSNKGVYDLLEGYAAWRPALPRARLVFAGTNWEGERFILQVHRTPGATYIGPVSHVDALTLMRGAEVVALPSRSEGLPYVILEAVSLGTKVIAPPDVPEFESHLPESVLPTVNATAIVAALTAAWARTAAHSYPISAHRAERVVNELVELYGRVIRDGGSVVTSAKRRP
jgi:glycosyltransferase involved in cell wall biosynthesis